MAALDEAKTRITRGKALFMSAPPRTKRGLRHAALANDSGRFTVETQLAHAAPAMTARAGFDTVKRDRATIVYEALCSSSAQDSPAAGRLVPPRPIAARWVAGADPS